MCIDCSDYEFYVGVAIDVFKARSRPSIELLKEFLTAIPNPICLESILVRAIAQLAANEPETCRWLLHHAEDLQPELNLATVAKQPIFEKLRAAGLIKAPSCSSKLEQSLQTDNPTMTTLLAEASALERLLMEEILPLYSSEISS